MKAAEVEDAQKEEVERLQEDRDVETSAAIANAAIGDIFGSSDIRRDVFYPPEQFWQTSIAVGLGITALLGYSSDTFLQRLFPSFVLTFRNFMTADLMRLILKSAGLIHVAEGVIALGICLKRKWYSPLNVFRWTLSTTLYGVASMSKLLKHGKMIKEKEKHEKKE